MLYNCYGVLGGCQDAAIQLLHSKKYWVVLTQFWVKYGQTQTLGYIFK